MLATILCLSFIIQNLFAQDFLSYHLPYRGTYTAKSDIFRKVEALRSALTQKTIDVNFCDTVDDIFKAQYYTAFDEESGWKNAKHLAYRDLIRGINSEFLKACELLSGNQALDELKVAIETDDPSQLVRVAAKYPFLKGGIQSAIYLAKNLVDGGKYSEAVIVYEDLATRLDLLSKINPADYPEKILNASFFSRAAVAAFRSKSPLYDGWITRLKKMNTNSIKVGVANLTFDEFRIQLEKGERQWNPEVEPLERYLDSPAFYRKNPHEQKLNLLDHNMFEHLLVFNNDLTRNWVAKSRYAKHFIPPTFRRPNDVKFHERRRFGAQIETYDWPLLNCEGASNPEELKVLEKDAKVAIITGWKNVDELDLTRFLELRFLEIQNPGGMYSKSNGSDKVLNVEKLRLSVGSQSGAVKMAPMILKIFKGLQFLELVGIQFEMGAFEDDHFSKLRLLSLTNEWSCLNLKIFGKVANLRSLESLAITMNESLTCHQEISDFLTLMVKKAPSLLHLKLNLRILSLDKQIELTNIIAGFKNLQSLDFLDLNSDILAKIPHTFLNCKYLSLGRLVLHDGNFDEINKHFPSLEYLKISSTNLDDEKESIAIDKLMRTTKLSIFEYETSNPTAVDAALKNREKKYEDGIFSGSTATSR